MTAPLAIGIGCRRGIAAEVIVSVLLEAAENRDLAAAGIYTIDRKRDEPGLTEAASRLGIPIRYLSPERLRAVPQLLSGASVIVERLVGVASVAEAAALAGAGAWAQLLGAKLSRDGVTCAIAIRSGEDLP